MADNSAPDMIGQDALRVRASIQSQTINLMRFVLIFLVVCHHVGDRVAPPLPDFNLFDISLLHFTGDDFYKLFRAFFDTIRGNGNTGFFLISGYLFFFNVKEWNAAAYIGKLRKRLFTLLIPYLLWNLIAAGTRPLSLMAGDRFLAGGGGRAAEYFQSIADKGFLSIFWDFSVWEEAHTNMLGWPMPSFGPVCIPLWFLQSLIFLALVSPAIHFIARRAGLFGISVLFVLYFTEIWFSVPAVSVSAIFYYTLGAYFAVHGKNMVYELRRRGAAFLSLAVLSFVASMVIEYGRLDVFNYAKGVFTLTATMSTMVIASYVIEKGLVHLDKEISKSVFFIYASHSALLVVTATGVLYEILTFHSKTWYTLTVGYLVVPAATMCLCYAVHRVLRRIMPPVAKLLSGNR